VGVVKEITEFYYRKEGKGLQCSLFQVEWRHPVQEKEKE
jgi:hypothetical protein